MKTNKKASFKKGRPNFKSKQKEGAPKSRKEKRKELRQAKKQRQQQHVVNKFKRGQSKDEENTIEKINSILAPKKTKIGENINEINKTKSTEKLQKGSSNKKDRFKNGPTQSVKAEKQRLQKEMHLERAKQLKLANIEEDKNIKRLAKQLKLNRRKSKSIPKSFASEGLDYLLEVCDPEKLKLLGKNPTALDSSGSEFEDDFAEVTGLKTIKKTKDEDTDDSEDDIEDGSDFEDDGDEQEEIDQEDIESDDNSNSDVDSSDDAEVPSPPKIQKSATTSKKSGKRVRFEDEEETSKKSKKLKREVKRKVNDLSNFGKARKVRSIDIEDDLEGSADDEEEDDEGDFDKEIFGSEDEDAEQDNLEGSDVEDNLDHDSEISGEEKEDPENWEDIYGRKRDKQGNVIQETTGRYVPPALRAGATSDAAKLLRLRRQMQGLLNRVAESNMAGVASQLEEVIMTHSRGDSCEVLGHLLHTALVPSHSVTPTKLAAEHGLLLAMLHAHIGPEIGAQFLQTTVLAFNQKHPTNQEIEDKTLNNLLLILCFMYCFKMFHCLLMFDILRMLSEHFSEKDVELILLVLKTVGPSLRKDDPVALKEIVLQLQKQASAATQHKENTRIRFMLDVLLAIKNNNMSRIPDYDPELVDHLRKVLRGLLRANAQVSELKISLQDLLHAEERGRWWVVGSAWQGAGPGVAGTENLSTSSHNFSQKLLELARKQRMNTDVRRNIFCILMTAEDYLDAFEKLLKLGLKGQQEREVSYVLLDCCLQEKKYNPYYSHLAQKFCDFDRKYRMSLQCSIWDKIKELSGLTQQQLRNLASFTSHLILGNGLSLSVLKVIQFADLEKVSVKFVRQVLLGLLLSKDEFECVSAFTRVPASDQLALFRQSISIFLHRYVLRKQHQLPEGTDAELLKSRVTMAEQALTSTDHKTVL